MTSLHEIENAFPLQTFQGHNAMVCIYLKKGAI